LKEPEKDEESARDSDNLVRDGRERDGDTSYSRCNRHSGGEETVCHGETDTEESEDEESILDEFALEEVNSFREGLMNACSGVGRESSVLLLRLSSP
jgi:hypothetical protein